MLPESKSASLEAFWKPPRLLCSALGNLFWINLDSCKQKVQESHCEGYWLLPHPNKQPWFEPTSTKSISSSVFGNSDFA